jgi:hypothetical protein
MIKYLFHFLKWSKSFIERPFLTIKWFKDDFKKDKSSKKFNSIYKKVWCAGLPKSGTTLIENIIDNLPYVSLNNSILRVYYPGKLDHRHGISNQMFQNIPKEKYTFLKTHTHYEKTYEEIAKNHNLKIIISVRDLRDMLISRYFHIMNDKNHWQHDQIKNLDFTDGFIYSAKSSLNKNLPNALDYYYYWILNWLDEAKKKDYLILWYEDYLNDSDNYIKKILNYLEFNELSINEIKAKLNINNEKNKKISFKDSLQKYGRLRSTFREGENDGWKKYFNDKIINFFEKNIPDSIDKITYKN